MKKKAFKVLKRVTLGILTLFVLLVVLVVTTSNDEKVTTPEKHISQGEVLRTRYFDVTVNSARTYGSVSTGNMFVDLPAEEGIRYLVLNVTFKNTDDESRTIIDGEVMIDYEGKRYRYDKSEVVLAEGWGLLLDQINPLTSKTTNLVYKIPAEIKGNIWYNPGRSGKNDLIFIGSIK